MPKINTEDIRGYYVDDLIICIEHATEHEAATAKLNDIILSDDIEKDSEKQFFCERCQELL